MKRQCPSAAFTLVELLVVVAIIALLLSILLPSLSRAQAVAKSVVCGSNQRQIGLTFTMYADQYNRYWPAGIQGPAWGDGPWWYQWFHNGIGPMMANREFENANDYADWMQGSAMECPAALSEPPNNRIMGRGYGYNIDINTDDPKQKQGATSAWREFKRPDEVISPTRTFYLVDTMYDDSTNNDRVLIGYNDVMRTLVPRASTRHQGQLNFLFVDGHREEISAENPDLIEAGTLGQNQDNDAYWILFKGAKKQ